MMKNWDTIAGLFALVLLSFITYKTRDGFYAVLSFLPAWYLLYKARGKALAWLNGIEKEK